jgi:membrane-bound serine protease (ClpP class)
MALFFAFVAPVALRARKLPVITGVERLIGTEGVVVRALNPQGTARIAAEVWTAESIGGTVRKGERVRVVAAEGLRLVVEPVRESEEAESETVGGAR